MARIHLQQKAKVSQTSIQSMEQGEPEVIGAIIVKSSSSSIGGGGGLLA